MSSNIGRSFFRYLLLICLMMALLLPQIALASAWQLRRNFWTEEDEKVYGDFVAAIGASRHNNLNRFIKDAKANPLYGDEDNKFNLSPDCADLPYVIRAYVAYKLRLPFAYVSAIAGRGGDQRYSRGNRPVEFKDQDYFSSPQQLFSRVILVNSGYFRMAADVEGSDYYPVRVQRESIKPGTIYYDPDGHIAMVSQVFDDGRIRMISAHPDRSISKPWFGNKFTKGTAANGGGFKRWRPIRYTSDGKILKTLNHNIVDYSADDQYQKTFSARGRTGLSYYDFVRTRLSSEDFKHDPVAEFVFMMQDLHEDISYRALAVNICIEKKIHQRSHPGNMPRNIYGTDGIWEEYSTPSRDARLKVAFKDFYDRTRAMVLQYAASYGAQQAAVLTQTLLARYHDYSPALSVYYLNSIGNKVTLSFDEVCTRLFKMSFDPYHPIEYRWGASGQELLSAPFDASKKRFYDLQYRLRNQLERVYNVHTPLSMGPETPPQIKVRPWLEAFLANPVYIMANESLDAIGSSPTVYEIVAASGINASATTAITPEALVASDTPVVSQIVSQIASQVAATDSATIASNEALIEEPAQSISLTEILFELGDKIAEGIVGTRAVTIVGHQDLLAN